MPEPRRQGIDRPERATRQLRPALEPLEARFVLAATPSTAGFPPEGILPRAHHIGNEQSALPAVHEFKAPEVIKGVVYNRRGGHLDLFVPGGTPPTGGWPVVLALEGAGWRRAGREPYGSIVAGALGRHGYAVASADYAAASPGHSSWPTNLEDAQDAVRWLRANARRIGVDPARIVALGESAGGHLAALLGTDPGPVAPGAVSDHVQAVVDFYGPADLVAIYNEGPGPRSYVVPFLGGTPAQIPARYADASPILHVAPGDPPTLILQGTNDTGVLPVQSVRFAAALAAAGVPNQLTLIPGAAHGFHFLAAGQDLAPEVATFLDAALGIRNVK